MRPNAALARDLTNRLGTPVVVYDTDWFHVIAPSDLDKEVREYVVPNVVEAVSEFRGLFHYGRDEKPPWKGGDRGRLVLLKDQEACRKYPEDGLPAAVSTLSRDEGGRYRPGDRSQDHRPHL